MNILFDAALAFPISGAQAVALPALDAPNMMTNKAMKTSSTCTVGFPFSSALLFMISPPAQKRRAKTENYNADDKPRDAATW